MRQQYRMTRIEDDESSDRTDIQFEVEECCNSNNTLEKETMAFEDDKITVSGNSHILNYELTNKPIILSLSSSGMKLYVKNEQEITTSICEKTERSHVQCPRKSTNDWMNVNNQKSGCSTKSNQGNQSKISGTFLADQLDPLATDNAITNRVEMNTKTIKERTCKRRWETSKDTEDEEYLNQNRIFKKYKNRTSDTLDEECEEKNNEQINYTLDERDMDQSNERNATIVHKHVKPLKERMCQMDMNFFKKIVPIDTVHQLVQKGRKDEPFIQQMIHRDCYNSGARHGDIHESRDTSLYDTTKEHICQCRECHKRIQFYPKNPKDQERKTHFLNNSEVFDCNCNSCCSQSGTPKKTQDMLICRDCRNGEEHVQTLHSCCMSPCQANCGNLVSRLPVDSEHNETHTMCNDLELQEEINDGRGHIKSQINQTDAINNDLTDENSQDTATFLDFISAQNLTNLDQKEQFEMYARYLRKDMREKYKRFNSLVKAFNDGLHEPNCPTGENDNDNPSKKCVIM